MLSDGPGGVIGRACFELDSNNRRVECQRRVTDLFSNAQLIGNAADADEIRAWSSKLGIEGEYVYIQHGRDALGSSRRMGRLPGAGLVSQGAVTLSLSLPRARDIGYYTVRLTLPGCPSDGAAS